MSFSYDFGIGVRNNGNVYRVANLKEPARGQNFAYDALNRIAAAWTDGPVWGGRYTIDAWGNLTNIECYPGRSACETLNQPANALNRIGADYDLAGNWNNGNTYLYDAENRLTHIGGSLAFMYDGDGKRVKKMSGKLYWTGTSSDALVETDLAGNNATEYIFFNGKRIARIANGSMYYYFADHLGTSRVMTTATGEVCYDADFYPYGREQHVYANTCSQDYKFTGKERDTETGLDYFGARYYGSNMGRFMSPDWSAKPSPVPFAKFDDPQTLNLYSYVRNNPLNRFDVDGHCDSSDKATAKTKCQDTKNLKVNDAGLKHIEKSEGFKDKAYLDTGKKLTVGYGHLVTEKDGIKLGDKITKEKAEEFLKADIASAEKAVKDAAGNLQLSQGEFNALADAAYNVGPGVFTTDKSPSLMTAMGKGDYQGMSEQLRYTKDALGVSQPGLATRSDERKQIFLGTDPD